MANASLTSDYRYRGYSLSAERPAVAATVAYDHPGGVYLNATALGVLTRHDGAAFAGYQAYLGYARRFDADSTWEVGVSNTEVVEHYRPRYRVQYSELYAGVTTRRLSAHLYYSPDYLGEGAQTLHASFGGALSPGPDWRMFGRLGATVPVKRRADSEIRRVQYDLAAGVARRLGDCEVQFAVSHFGPARTLVAGEPQARTTAVLSGTVYF